VSNDEGVPANGAASTESLRPPWTSSVAAVLPIGERFSPAIDRLARSQLVAGMSVMPSTSLTTSL